MDDFHGSQLSPKTTSQECTPVSHQLGVDGPAGVIGSDGTGIGRRSVSEGVVSSGCWAW